MTHDDRVMTWAIAITFALSALVMTAIVVKGHALHDRFFATDEPAATSVHAASGETVISAEPGLPHQPVDAAAITPFAHYWSSAQRSRHLVVPDPAVTQLADDERAFSFEADRRDRDER